MITGTIISTILGFLAPLLPKVFDAYKEKRDYAHELALGKQSGDQRLALLKAGVQGEIDKTLVRGNLDAFVTAMQSEVDDRKDARAHDAGMGAFSMRLLTIAKDGLYKWAYSVIVLLYALADTARTMVRPGITLLIVLCWGVVKFCFIMRGIDSGMEAHDAIIATWNADDYGIMGAVIGFWFGARYIDKVNVPKAKSA